MNIKKALTSLTVLILLTGFSQAKDFSLHVEPFIGLKNGHLGEHVFVKNPESASDTGKTPDNQLSYLNWQIKNEFYLGSKVNLTWKSLFAHLQITTALPQNSGIIKDSDWKNIDLSTLAEYQSYKTNYSESDNFLDYDYSFFIASGWIFNPISTLKISPLIGFEYSKTKFTATGGWYSYGDSSTDINGTAFYSPWNDSTNSTQANLPSDTTVLEYMREQTSFWAGFDISYTFNSKFTFERDLILNIGFKIAPYIYTFNQDDHPLGGTKHFTDVCYGYFKNLKVSQDLSYKLNDNLAFNLNLSYSKLFTIQGVNYTSNDKTTWSKSTADEGGASASTFEVSLGCKYKFF